MNGIPWVRFARGDRKIDVMQPKTGRGKPRPGRPGGGVGGAQEFQRVWAAASVTRAPPRRSTGSPRPNPGDLLLLLPGG